MSDLTAFSYGERLDGDPPRSLGFRLLEPAEAESWAGEVEALARRLQAAPYPDHWPVTELFCSVLLEDGSRLIAKTRYGLTDHTQARRRGGLELTGIVARRPVGVAAALAVYQWLRQSGAVSPDAIFALAGIIEHPPPLAAPPDPVSVLPIQLWQEGAMLFAATAPSDPDTRLGLLQQSDGTTWQWLPLVGGDFPLARFAERGPLIAWTPHLAGVAVKLDQPPAPVGSAAAARPSIVPPLMLAAALAMLAANLWLTANIARRPLTAPAVHPVAAPVASELSATRLADALHRHLARQGAMRDADAAQLRSAYEQLVARDDAFRVDSPEGRLALGAVSVLARRGPARVEAVIREAVAGHGYDPELIELLCRRVQQKLGESREP